MARKILGVIAGYIAMAAFVFILFTLLYLILGTEGAFVPGSYRVSGTWLVLSIVLSFIAAVTGGYICTVIAKNRKTVFILAGIVFVLGLILAIPSLGEYGEAVDMTRNSSLSNMEAMQNAKQPDAVLLLNPVIGALGVLLGARLWKEK